MKRMQPPNTLHLRAAQGWLELGNLTEANEELEKISPALRCHPDVLEVRWPIYSRLKRWDVCLDIATAITKLAPNRLIGFLNLASSLHRLNRTQEAYDTLSSAERNFPDASIVFYDLACYAAQLGKLEEAKARLERAFEIGDAMQLKLMALDDSDLEPLWMKHDK